MFFVDKYTVNNIQDVKYNTSVYERFGIFDDAKLLKMDNMIIAGSESSGKNTFVRMLLTKIYGNDVNNIKQEEFTIKNYGSNAMKVMINMTRYTMYFTPNGNALDKYIIQEIIQDFLSRKDLYLVDTDIKFKTIIIDGFDNLNNHTQASLRRTLEERSKYCRFILVGNNISTLLLPLRRRCVNVLLPVPDDTELLAIGSHINTLESLGLKDSELKRIVNNSQNNVRKLYWMLNMKVMGLDYKVQWHSEIETLCKIIFTVVDQNQVSVTTINKIRQSLGKLFISNLNENDICGEIFKNIYNRILQKYSKVPLKGLELVSNVQTVIASFNYRVQNSTRYILHLEAMILNIMRVLMIS